MKSLQLQALEHIVEYLPAKDATRIYHRLKLRLRKKSALLYYAGWILKVGKLMATILYTYISLAVYVGIFYLVFQRTQELQARGYTTLEVLTEDFSCVYSWADRIVIILYWGLFKPFHFMRAIHVDIIEDLIGFPSPPQCNCSHSRSLHQ